MAKVLGIFAKQPRPGAVKTRLAAAIGSDAAARLYDAFLRDLLPRLVTIEATRVLAFADPADSDFFRLLCEELFDLEVQSGQDLGARMANFFRNQFARGADRVVLIGSDSPDLPLACIESAFDALDRHDVVLGPCDDGGYYLVGMNRAIPAMFERIDWSTPNVFAQTKSRLDQLGIQPAVLESWYDVDSLDDLRRLAHAIRSRESTMYTEPLVQTIEQLKQFDGLSEPETQYDYSRDNDVRDGDT